MDKRKYNSDSRRAQAELNRQRILAAAKTLFSSKGFEKTTIDKIAASADVSAPTIYALFKSKEGILRELYSSVLFGRQYEVLVESAGVAEDPKEALKTAAHITRKIFDAEKLELGFIWGASILSPEIRKLEAELESQRYERQKVIVIRFAQNQLLRRGLNIVRAREILWSLTGRDIYRMLVIERGWTSTAYEKWLEQTLLHSLVNDQGI